MSIAKVLFGLPPLLNIFIALSIPLLYPGLNLALLDISFVPVGAQTSLAFTPNIASGINGQVNDETVKDLLSIQVSLTRWDSLNHETNLVNFHSTLTRWDHGKVT